MPHKVANLHNNLKKQHQPTRLQSTGDGMTPNAANWAASKRQQSSEMTQAPREAVMASDQEAEMNTRKRQQKGTAMLLNMTDKQKMRAPPIPVEANPNTPIKLWSEPEREAGPRSHVSISSDCASLDSYDEINLDEFLRNPLDADNRRDKHDTGPLRGVKSGKMPMLVTEAEVENKPNQEHQAQRIQLTSASDNHRDTTPGGYPHRHCLGYYVHDDAARARDGGFESEYWANAKFVPQINLGRLPEVGSELQYSTKSQLVPDHMVYQASDLPDDPIQIARLGMDPRLAGTCSEPDDDDGEWPNMRTKYDDRYEDLAGDKLYTVRSETQSMGPAAATIQARANDSMAEETRRHNLLLAKHKQTQLEINVIRRAIIEKQARNNYLLSAAGHQLHEAMLTFSKQSIYASNIQNQVNTKPGVRP